MDRKKKRIIGITGGIGAGKSRVLEILGTQFGAKVILADLVAHALMEPGSEGLARVTEVLGTGFLRADGSADRSLLAELIFHDEAALKAMNRVIHPMVWEWIQREASACREHLVIVEAAVFDTAPAGLFDEVWYVYASEETRICRLMGTRGYTREKCVSIIAKQASEDAYRSRSTRIIDNDGDVSATEKQLKEILGHEIC